jgi:hypothetical protein
LAHLLHSQIDAGDLAMMLTAAEAISAKFGASQGGKWRHLVIGPKELVSLPLVAGWPISMMDALAGISLPSSTTRNAPTWAG